jgi:hypothetical protein
MESHALHGDGIYYESDDTVWVNLFAPSTATLASGAGLKMDTGFPDGDTATITMTAGAPKAFTLAVRRPSWAGDNFAVKVNGVAVEQPPLASLRAGGAGGRNVGGDAGLQPSSYVELARTWKAGDTIELSLPKSLRLEPTPDDRRIAAIMWGPLVLAGDLGPRREPQRGRGAGAGPAAPPTPIPMLVAAERPPAEWIAAVPARAGDFTVQQVARVAAAPATPADVSLTPFYRTHRRTYSLYFDFFTPAEWETRAAEIAAERERVRKLEAATLAFVQPGDAQAERDRNYQSDPPDRQAPRANGRSSRSGTGWFSYDLPVDGTTAMAIVVTYQGSAGSTGSAGSAGSPFEILVDGTSIAKFTPDPKAEGFYDVQYAVPANLVRGRTKVTVKFQAATGGRIAPVFGVRMIRAN